MDERSETLSGQWLGRYEYQRGARPVAFEADIIEDAGTISGITSEPNSFHPGMGAVLTATLAGTCAADEVQFTKIYQGFTQDGLLIYQGRVNAARNRIEGRWHFAELPSWSGRFVMMRKPKAAARAARSAEVERALAFTGPE
jgi:hypothetical protein